MAKQGPKDFLNQTADLAVDGNISQNADAGLCAHTNGIDTAWWSVDFNGSYFLSRIRILRRLKGKYRVYIIKFYLILAFKSDRKKQGTVKGSKLLECNCSPVFIPRLMETLWFCKKVWSSHNGSTTFSYHF